MTRGGALARLALLAALAAPAAIAQSDAALLSELGIPAAASGWITDTAGVLDAGTRAELEDLAARYQKGSGHDVAVLILPTLHDRPIEKVGLEVFRTWKLGREGVNDGALLLVATADHDLRIEVGRGLEGDLTDLICGRIIRNVIVPHFKEGDLPGGVRAGVIAIHAAAGGDYADIPEDQPVDQTLPPLVAIGIILLIVIIVMRARRGGRGGRRGPFVMPFPFPLVLGGRSGGGFGGFGGGGFGGGGFGGGGGGFGGFGGGGGAIGGGASGHW